MPCVPIHGNHTPPTHTPSIQTFPGFSLRRLDRCSAEKGRESQVESSANVPKGSRMRPSWPGRYPISLSLVGPSRNKYDPFLHKTLSHSPPCHKDSPPRAVFAARRDGTDIESRLAAGCGPIAKRTGWNCGAECGAGELPGEVDTTVGTLFYWPSRLKGKMGVGAGAGGTGWVGQ
ncbi:predicted protein [Plenodomus lingam JN3]|uniref:Predicted protein n=1 Tax=Leptosphaeria maculans (strain JN3 / isolate v23.1.3 / race Av1-4-5-6-7-8) TaxID=985895 RepID=E4ZXZ4_LEPMJ|nr:predicted protein [Plenodomus lingam JN3]CBX96239.1 predicted protein [Plenodomus lingam JN3]